MIELAAMIGEDGTLCDVRVIQALGFGLDQKAVECVSGWRFEPARDVSGAAISVPVKLFVKFELPLDGWVSSPVRC